jgi:Ca-activated chloride channel homolog
VVYNSGSVRRLFLLVSALAATGAAGQQPSPSPAAPVFSVGLDAVNVTVSVRDDKGNLVTDLRREDFEVWEDGQRQELQVFARAFEAGHDEALSLDLGLLFDTSQSMLEQLKLSQQAATRFLESVPRARELYTIFFDEEIRLSRYDSENQQGLIERIHAAKGGGNTALYDAIAVYLSRVQGASGRKVLVLFTDGEDSKSSLTLHECLELLRSSTVTVYSIGFTAGFSAGSNRGLQSRAFLQQVADMTGGQLFSPTGSKSLGAIYRKILDELEAQYVLGFASKGSPNGKFRKLKVEVKRKGLKVHHRPGYYPPLPPDS